MHKISHVWEQHRLNNLTQLAHTRAAYQSKDNVDDHNVHKTAFPDADALVFNRYKLSVGGAPVGIRANSAEISSRVESFGSVWKVTGRWMFAVLSIRVLDDERGDRLGHPDLH